MERGAPSTILTVLLVLFLLQFFIGMAMNLVFTFPKNVFPTTGGLFDMPLSGHKYLSKNLGFTAH
jgi:hypothetical protein